MDSNDTATTTTTTALLIITTVNPLVAIMTALCYLCLYSLLYWCVFVYVCVCLGVGSCAHCVLIVWVWFAFSNLFCGLCNLFSLTLHGPNVCVSVCVCKCFVYVCHPMINSMAARNMEIKTQQQSLHPTLPSPTLATPTSFTTGKVQRVACSIQRAACTLI